MPKLRIEAGQDAGLEYVVTSALVRMGRRSTSNIIINDEKSSRDHCEVFKKDDVFWLRDLNSRNGTSLNGDKIVEKPLRHGDVIRIGATLIVFIEEDKGDVSVDVSAFQAQAQAEDLVNILDITENADVSEEVIEDLSSVSLSGYAIIDLVGSERFGNVYKARQISMDRIVTLKILKDEYKSNNEVREAFLEEARLSGKINHPNVLQIHDVGEKGGQCYFSREFLKGRSLEQLLAEKRRLPLPDALDFVSQLNKALAFIHQKDIVTGCLHPSNIFIGKDGQAKIASLLLPALEEPLVNRFLSPEQLSGESADHRADIYSLGAIFYYCLTGVEPFQVANREQEIVDMMDSGELLASPADYNEDLPEELLPLIERMMARKASYRFLDSNELEDTIAAFKSGRLGTGSGLPGAQSLIALPNPDEDPPGPMAKDLAIPDEPTSPRRRGGRSRRAPQAFSDQMTVMEPAISGGEDSIDFGSGDDDAFGEPASGRKRKRHGKPKKSGRGKNLGADEDMDDELEDEVRNVKSDPGEKGEGLSTGAKIGVLFAGILVFGAISFAILNYGLKVFDANKGAEKVALIEGIKSRLDEAAKTGDTNAINAIGQELAKLTKKKELTKEEAAKLVAYAKKKLDDANAVKEDAENNPKLEGNVYAGKAISEDLNFVKITIDKITLAEVKGKNAVKIHVTLENTSSKTLQLDAKQFWVGSGLRDQKDTFKENPIQFFDAPLKGMAPADNSFARKETVKDIIVFAFDKAGKAEVFDVRLDLNLKQKSGDKFEKLTGERRFKFFFKSIDVEQE